jgi:hypothetical protein
MPQQATPSLEYCSGRGVETCWLRLLPVEGRNIGQYDLLPIIFSMVGFSETKLGDYDL